MARLLSVKDRIAVCYRSDPTLWHERIVCSLLAGKEIISLTPDLELCHADLQVTADSQIMGVRSFRTDGSVLCVKEDNLFTIEKARGQGIDDSELDEWITEATLHASMVDNAPTVNQAAGDFSWDNLANALQSCGGGNATTPGYGAPNVRGGSDAR